MLDYALERYEKYQLAIKETTGYVVPWSLDDLDPKTVFDAQIREKVEKAIAAFRQILLSRGYKEETDEHEELLGLSLYAFALAPEDGNFPKMEITEESKILAKKLKEEELPYYFKTQGRLPELEKAGLNAVFSYLEKEGGLGIITTQEDCGLESTALEALQKDCGWCTEKSAILHALFKMAKLKAQFTIGQPKYEFLTRIRITHEYLRQSQSHF